MSYAPPSVPSGPAPSGIAQALGKVRGHSFEVPNEVPMAGGGDQSDARPSDGQKPQQMPLGTELEDFFTDTLDELGDLV